MHKDAGVPRSFERVWSSVETFAALIKQHVSTLKNYLVRVALKVLDHDRPILTIFAVVNMEDARYDMSSRSINMHQESRIIPVHTQTVSNFTDQVNASPFFVHWFELVKYLSVQLIVFDEKRPGLITFVFDDIDFVLHGCCGEVVV